MPEKHLYPASGITDATLVLVLLIPGSVLGILLVVLRPYSFPEPSNQNPELFVLQMGLTLLTHI